MVGYIFITNEKNWEIIKKHNVMGISNNRKNFFERLEEKTKCIVYITRITSFGGIFEVTSTRSKKQIKWNEGKYQNIIELKPLKIFKNPIKIQPYIKNLEFIKNKIRWYGHVFHEHKIPESDIEFFCNLNK
jgi:predicted RNA-binding protein